MKSLPIYCAAAQSGAQSTGGAGNLARLVNRLYPLPKMARRTKKVGISGKYGTRYGASLRKLVKKFEAQSKAKYTCPFCGKDSVKRQAGGIWSCRSCKKTMAGGCWQLTTAAAATVRRYLSPPLPPPVFSSGYLRKMVLLLKLILATSAASISRNLALRGPGEQINRSLAGNGGLCDDQVAQLFGHLKGLGDAELFYWLFEARVNPDKSHMLIFFQGGPGASSMYSVTSGNGGPCILNDAGTDTTINTYSYNSFANVMYIDQPALVGFSEGTPPTNSSDAAKSTLVALEKFFSDNPKYNTEVFLVGQSYAGHYIPALAQEMHAQKSKINLKGVAIGNGLVVPEDQYPFMPQMAYDSETAPSVISKELYQKMQSQVQGCVAQIKNCHNKPWDPAVCKQARDDCLTDFVTPLVQMGIDTYDLRLTCPKPPAACRTYKKYEKYFNSKKVQDYLQVEATWIFLNKGVAS
ncbi:hypothetical protein FOZ60_012927 [Perkinsus olseni]|uniref:Uncharacterized protein n=1 Tax=Perkinsus olseni TaxID=32597 RepID=A0A7J6P920_PEROL|nr:hypothetical protein FOZ60_012927 [Perkinsus olseni]